MQLQRESEHLLLIKTTRKRFAALRDRIIALHPHDVPEVLAVEIVDGQDRYIDWIAAETHRPEEQ